MRQRNSVMRVNLLALMVTLIFLLFGCGGGSDSRAQDGSLAVNGLYIGQDFQEAVATADELFADRLESAQADYESAIEARENDDSGATNQTRVYFEERNKTDSEYTIGEYFVMGWLGESAEGGYGDWSAPQPTYPTSAFEMTADDDGKLSYIWTRPPITSELFGDNSTVDLDGFAQRFADGYNLGQFETQWRNDRMFKTQVEGSTRVIIGGQDGEFTVELAKEAEGSFN